MWPRKQLDIGWRDLAFGLRSIFVSRKRPAVEAVVGNGWMPRDEALITLSVRTGWDLLLTALELPAGSEVIVSAVTISDMVRIIERHGLVPVPVGVDPLRLEPDLEQIERSISPNTRAILVAHLFGTRVEMGPINRLAKQFDLLVIEDCAQAFAGDSYAGHADADCAMFSFGPIKTATALGGAVLRVRDAALRARMVELESDYPVQKHSVYRSRIAKYAFLRWLCLPRIYGAVVRSCSALGIDYDSALSNAAHSFGAADFFAQIRRRPSVPLLRMLERRIGGFRIEGAPKMRRRIECGDRLAAALRRDMVIGSRNESHTYWVATVRVENGDEVITALRRAGFDATARASMIVVPAANGSADYDPPLAPWLAETVFLPSGEDMPESEWDRLIAVLSEVARDRARAARGAGRGAERFCDIMSGAALAYRWNTSAAAEAYDQAAPAIHPFYEAIQDQILGWLPFASHEPFIVIDLGGGSGRLAARLLQRFDCAKAVLVDQSEPFLALAERRLQPFTSRATLIQRRLQDNWAADLAAAPDAIVSTSAIHHLEPAEKRALFARCFAMLRPGGVFINGDEFRPVNDDEYRALLEGWSGHMNAAIDAGRIPASFRQTLDHWYDRNIRGFGEPKTSGDDCHETLTTQFGYLQDAGFAQVETVWAERLWGVIKAGKFKRTS